MAFIDTQHERLTIRIVFDGLPEVGKTETVRALAESVGERLLTPEERDRRTVYFDWMEHTAGLFGGRPIHCQVLSVPGQAGLAERRRTILSSADAVVFVVDSRPCAVQQARERWCECRELAGRNQVGQLVVQANKQDLDDALEPRAVAEILDVDSADVVATTATDRDGVRVVFLQAVRAALQRVRQLDAAGELDATDATEASGAQALFDEVSEPTRDDVFRDESPSTEWSEERTLGQARATPWFRDSLAGSVKELDPEDLVENGLIWPPIEGRLFVQEALRDEVTWDDAEVDGRRVGVGRDWCFLAAAPAVSSHEEAQGSLLDLAREHFRLQELLSSDRCLAALGSEQEGWRLWQIYRRRTSVRDVLDRSVWSGISAHEAARVLRQSATRVGQSARELRVLAADLRIDLGRLGFDPDDAPVVGAFEVRVSRCDWREEAADELVAFHHELRSRHDRAVFDAVLGSWQEALWSLEEAS